MSEIQTQHVSIGRQALRQTAEIARRSAPAQRWTVVADERTWQAAGAAVQAVLEAAQAGPAAPLVLPGTPRLKATTDASAAVAAHLRDLGAGTGAIAVGAGVINDIVKHAAHVAGVPYLCCATAASMDGYAASGAALLEGGFKRTLACPPPLALIADTDVVAAAPPQMVAWGYGDLAGKAVAGADWLLADAIGVEPLNPVPFAMVQEPLARWLAEPEAIAQRTPQAMERLLDGLVASGRAMQWHGNSRPASGSDHQFAHLWEMENLQHGGEPVSHGACVGIGCVAMLALYDWLLARPDAAVQAAALQHRPAFDPVDDEIRWSLGDGPIAEAARQEMQAKRAGGERQTRVQRFAAAWPHLRGQLLRRGFSAPGMRQLLRRAGAACDPADIGVTPAQLRADYRRARLIRRRYTLLDLLEDIGWLEPAVDDLFSHGGFWTTGGQPVAEPARGHKAIGDKA